MLAPLRNRLRLFTHAWHTVGPTVMLRHALRWSTDPDARAVDSGFDADHGTDTSTPLTPAEAGIPAARRASATMYLPTMDADLATLLAALPWPEPLVRDATFVDLGSGKGRVVLLAGMRHFRAVVGVELSPKLHAIATDNLRRVQRAGHLRSPIELVQADAAAFAVPRGPLIAFLYHPFGADVASAVIDRLAASLAATPRPAAILYGHPTLQAPLAPSVLTRHGVFDRDAAGARRSRHYRRAWSVWTNRAWLARRVASPAAAAGVGEGA